MCVGIFSSNHDKSIVWSGQRFNTNKAKEANGWTPALQHYHVGITMGRNICCDEPNNMTWLGNMCHAKLMCKHTETGRHLTSWEIDDIRWWCPPWFNATWHDTYGFDFNILLHTWISGSTPPPQNTKINEMDDLRPGCQDLCPIITQTTRIWGIFV